VRILVTGGSGFIGHHLMKELLSKGENEIIVIDNLSARGNNNLMESTIKRSPNKSVVLYNEDILNKNIVLDIFKREGVMDTCIHLAAKVSMLDSVRNPADP
jgi:UDP-glucose 4-epimerase